MHAHVRERLSRVEQGLTEALVDLDDVHVLDALGQVLGQNAQPSADLQHNVLVGQLGGAADHAKDVRVDQEVLPQLAIGCNAELLQSPQAGLDRRRGRAGRPRCMAPARSGGIRHEPAHQPNTPAALRSTVVPSSDADTPRSSARKATVCATNAG